MQNRVVGDTLLFRRFFSDEEGTAITTGTGTLVVTDFLGSVVYDGTVPHRNDGTWGANLSSVGFANGPLTEVWKSKSSFGTFTFFEQNNYRIIGTTTIRPYVMPHELHQWYEQIPDYFTGDEEAIVQDACNEINSRIEAIGYKLPFKPKVDGFYDQSLRDWNAYEAILRIVARRQASYNREEETPWFDRFKEEAGSIYRKFQNKEFNFDRDYSVSESGIGLATKVAGTRPAQMETNWRGGIGTGFQDYTFERDWKVVITGTGTAGESDEGTFKWSRDGGLSFATAYPTNFNWQHLQDGVYVRFHRGTSTGSINLYAVNDEWNFKTFPRNQSAGGKRSAISY